MHIFMTHPSRIIPFTALIVVLMAAPKTTRSAVSPQKPSRDIVIGREFRLPSKILEEERAVHIALPDGYDSSSGSFPVLYTLYNGDAGFTHTVGTTRMLYDIKAAPRLIVASVNVDGMRDLTPTKTPNYGPTSGGADRFIRFLKEELIPFMDRSYRTSPHRIYWSHSIGGTLGVYALLSEPDLFYACLTSSPFFIYDGERRFLLDNTVRFLKKRTPATKNFLYISVGNEPGLKAHLDEFDRKLERAQPPGLEMIYVHMEKETHMSILARSLTEGLRSLFSKKNRIPGDWRR